MSAKHSPGPWAQAGQRVNGPHGVLVAWCGEASSIAVAGGFYAVSKTEAEAVRIARQCDAALARFIDVPGSASQSYHWPQVGRHPGSAG